MPRDIAFRNAAIPFAADLHDFSTWPGQFALMTVGSLIGQAAVLGLLGGAVWAAIPPASTMSPDERERAEQSVTYGGCNHVRALGKAPLYAGQPGYRETMDGDGDGIACEPIR